VNHDKVSEGVSNAFSSVPSECPHPAQIVPENEDKPIFSASMIQIRDDDVPHGHVGLF